MSEREIEINGYTLMNQWPDIPGGLMYEKAEITLIGGEVEVMKSMLKERIRELRKRGMHHMMLPYISVLDKIIEATREAK